MKNWIKENLNPVGMEKRNRGSLYSFIARVFDLVKKDSHTAFKAHFPMLANMEKLDEHAASLYVPHMESDSEEEFRKRVAAAAFFLSRAGERSYILNQLTEHFGSSYTLEEAFLRVQVKITDLSDEDRKWVIEFLDTILDPNILLSIAEWFNFVDKVELSEAHTITVNTPFTENFFRPVAHYANGRILADGESFNPDYVPAEDDEYIEPPFLAGTYYYRERFALAMDSGKVEESYRGQLLANGSAVADGNECASGFGIYSAYETFQMYMLKHYFANGKYNADGSINAEGVIAISLE